MQNRTDMKTTISYY